MAIIKCPECGHQISEKATVCPSCGVEIDGKVTKCESCGEVYFKDEGFCPSCHAPYKRGVSHSHEQRPRTQEKEEKPETSAGSAEQKEEKIQERREKQKQEKREEKDTEKSTETKEERRRMPETEPDDEQDFETESRGKKSLKRRVAPYLVSVVMAAIVGAVSIYFYKESKQAKEQQAYKLAMQSNDTIVMHGYLNTYGDAPTQHLDSVRSRIMYMQQSGRDWQTLMSNKTKDLTATFINSYPDSPHLFQATALLDSIDWAAAEALNTSAAYRLYMTEHAKGSHLAQARERVYGINLDTVEQEESKLVDEALGTFFTSVNENDGVALRDLLSDNVSSFMSTEHPTKAEVVGWMQRQHGESVKDLKWQPSEQVEITKRKLEGDKYEYVVRCNASQSMTKDGKKQNERFKVSATITSGGKLKSMDMIKVVAAEGETTTKPASTSSSKPATTSSSKPATTSSSKPASTSKPATTSSSKPASTSSSKPASTSKPSTSSSKPASTSKPSTSSSKPASTSKSSTSSSKPASTSKPSTSSSKPASTSKPSTSSSKPASTSKPSTSSKPASTSKSSTSSSKPASTSKSSTSSSKPASTSKSSTSSSKPASTSKPSTSSSKPASTSKSSTSSSKPASTSKSSTSSSKSTSTSSRKKTTDSKQKSQNKK